MGKGTRRVAWPQRWPEAMWRSSVDVGSRNRHRCARWSADVGRGGGLRPSWTRCCKQITKTPRAKVATFEHGKAVVGPNKMWLRDGGGASGPVRAAKSALCGTHTARRRATRLRVFLDFSNFFRRYGTNLVSRSIRRNRLSISSSPTHSIPIPLFPPSPVDRVRRSRRVRPPAPRGPLLPAPKPALRTRILASDRSKTGWPSHRPAVAFQRSARKGKGSWNLASPASSGPGQPRKGSLLAQWLYQDDLVLTISPATPSLSLSPGLCD